MITTAVDSLQETESRINTYIEDNGLVLTDISATYMSNLNPPSILFIITAEEPEEEKRSICIAL
jgi:hypothetical protein